MANNSKWLVNKGFIAQGSIDVNGKGNQEEPKKEKEIENRNEFML
jgi:hypothetical protein